MVTTQEKKQMVDGVIVSAGYFDSKTVILHTATKSDAEWLYSAVGNICRERELEETDEYGLHRNYYVELAESDEHSIDSDGDEFEWNTRPVYRVTFEPTDFCHQRMNNWNDNGVIKAPRDFTLTPEIGEMIVRAGSHTLPSDDGKYVEFYAENLQKLEAEFQNLDINTISVDDLWRIPPAEMDTFENFIGMGISGGE